MRNVLTNRFTRKELIEALQRGPQSVRPPSLHRLSKLDLMQVVERALCCDPGTRTRDQMEVALRSVRTEFGPWEYY